MDAMELLVENWEYVVIAILAVDKAVALSPSKWDDLIWTSVKKAIYKVNDPRSDKNVRVEVEILNQ